MFRSLIIVTIMLVKNIYTQDIIGTSCILESPNYPGICKLLIQCKEIRDEVVFHQKLPQTCGFEETQPIVCCPKPRRPGYMSESKCREYATYTKEKPLCGHSIVKRVVGGIPAGKTQFPHMALLGYRILSRYSVQWLCGGSLISEQYILTSGSCMYTEHREPKLALLGVTNINDPREKQEINVASGFTHPEYKKNLPYNDIALLKLERPVEMTSYVRPACLYINSAIQDTTAVATGWGATEYLDRSNNRNLFEVKLDIIDHQTCNDLYRNSSNLDKGVINDIHVCTGGATEGKGACEGDSGGPMQIYHRKDATRCIYDVVGVISVASCAERPTVNTRVSYYIKWIEDIVWPDDSE